MSDNKAEALNQLSHRLQRLLGNHRTGNWQWFDDIEAILAKLPTKDIKELDTLIRVAQIEGANRDKA